MLFCSYKFCQFFLAVFVAYWLVPWGRLRLRAPLPSWDRNKTERTWVLTGHEVRVWMLVVASFYFYASWNRRLALLICATTLMDYVIGRALDAISSPRWRRALFISSVVTNLGVLVYFKY